MRTEAEILALIGQTFGQGKKQRTVTRITNLWTRNHPRWPSKYWVGEVYWKRPGGKERSQSQWLPDFLEWLKKAERESNRHPLHTIRDIERHILKFVLNTRIEGFITVDGDEITIVFTVKP